MRHGVGTFVLGRARALRPSSCRCARSSWRRRIRWPKA